MSRRPPKPRKELQGRQFSEGVLQHRRQLAITQECLDLVNRGSIPLGTTERNSPLYLTPQTLGTHVAIQAPTGAGKSFLARQIIRGLLQQKAAIFVDDPKGDLFAGLEEDCAALNLDDRVILFESGRKDRIISFNPLQPNGLSPQDHTLWIMGAIKACWGQESFDATPQMARWLYNGIEPAIEARGTLIDALEALHYEQTATRSDLLAKTTDPLVLQEWAGYQALSKDRRRDETASAYARLRPFVHNPTIKRIVGNPESSLDLGAVLKEGKILLSHLPRYRA